MGIIFQETLHDGAKLHVTFLGVSYLAVSRHVKVRSIPLLEGCEGIFFVKKSTVFVLREIKL